jgi:hypothetical protein
LLVAWVLVVADAVAVVAALAIAASALAAGRPLGGVVWLLLPGVPLLVAGQVWTIVVLSARNPSARRRGRFGLSVRVRGRGAGHRLLFGDFLPKWLVTGVMALFVVAWCVGVTSFVWLGNGGPVQNSNGCRWGLDNHGTVTCVSESTYLRAGAAEDQLAGGLLGGFYTMHFGVALSEVYRRQGRTFGAGRDDP